MSLTVSTCDGRVRLEVPGGALNPTIRLDLSETLAWWIAERLGEAAAYAPWVASKPPEKASLLVEGRLELGSQALDVLPDGLDGAAPDLLVAVLGPDLEPRSEFHRYARRDGAQALQGDRGLPWGSPADHVGLDLDQQLVAVGEGDAGAGLQGSFSTGEAALETTPAGGAQ